MRGDQTDDGSDEQLWLRVQTTGDAAAFTIVFVRHVDRVATHCRRRLGSLDGFDDAVSSVFMAAWDQARRAHLVGGSLLPWLLVVGTNVTGKMLRARRVELRHLRRSMVTERCPDIASEVGERLDRDTAAAAVSLHMTQLSSRDQQILSLVFLGDLTHQQTADLLGVPVGTVKSRISRASARLREKLGDSGLDSSGPPSSLLRGSSTR